MPTEPKLKVFTFSPGFGLPTTGPFALKLLTWLRLAGVAYEQVHEDDPRKGPKGKNPWVELGGEPVGDTEVIIERIRRERGVSLDDALDPVQRAQALAMTRLVEEHLHQVFEWELIVEDDGFRHIAQGFSVVPFPLRGLVVRAFRGHFKKQLTARGIGRHDEQTRTSMGRRDIEALATLLDRFPFALGAEPSSVDATLFGFLGLMHFSPLETPVFRFAKEQNSLRTYCERMRARAFPELTSSVD